MPSELPASSQVYRTSEPSRWTPIAVRAAIFFAESSVKSLQSCPSSTSMSPPPQAEVTFCQPEAQSTSMVSCSPMTMLLSEASAFL